MRTHEVALLLLVSASVSYTACPPETVTIPRVAARGLCEFSTPALLETSTSVNQYPSGSAFPINKWTSNALSSSEAMLANFQQEVDITSSPVQTAGGLVNQPLHGEDGYIKFESTTAISFPRYVQLISPRLNLTVSANTVFKYELRMLGIFNFVAFAERNNPVPIEISTDDGATWTAIANLIQVLSIEQHISVGQSYSGPLTVTIPHSKLSDLHHNHIRIRMSFNGMQGGAIAIFVVDVAVIFETCSLRNDSMQR